jgi:beta-alanine degradation protein BauB
MKRAHWLFGFALAACASASAQLAPLPMALCAGWEGQRVCEALHEDAMIRVLRCTFPPNVGHEPHYHPPHFGYTLEGGAVRTRVEGQDYVTRTIASDGSWAMEAENRHETLNVGENTMRYLIIEKKYADARPASAVAPGLCGASPAPR